MSAEARDTKFTDRFDAPAAPAQRLRAASLTPDYQAQED
jgi:hypothetical protein